MATLSELQRAMHRLFRGQADVDQVAAELGAEPARLAIYRDFVRGHVRAALDKNYQYLARLLPAPRWDRLVADYFSAHPPTHWELNRAAQAFPEFLEGQADLDPFHVVLAQFEWEEIATYLAEPELPRAEELTAPALNPTLSVLQLPYDVVGFIVGHGFEGMTPDTPLPQRVDPPAVVFMYRDPDDWYARHEPATPELLLAFKVVADGIAVADAAAATGRSPAHIRELLADAAERGLIVLPRTG